MAILLSGRQFELMNDARHILKSLISFEFINTIPAGSGLGNYTAEAKHVIDILDKEFPILKQSITPAKVSLFDKWYNKEISGLGSFDVALFELFLLASGDNRSNLIAAFPAKFDGLQFGK